MLDMGGGPPDKAELTVDLARLLLTLAFLGWGRATLVVKPGQTVIILNTHQHGIFKT